MIEITDQEIERIAALCGELEDGKAVRNVLRRALNRAFGHAQTMAVKHITKTYNIKKYELLGATKIGKKTFDMTQDDLEASFEYAGNVIPLARFSLSAMNTIRGKNKESVKASIKKESGYKTLHHAFAAYMKYGYGIFERRTRARGSIEQLYGPSAAHMLDNPIVQDDIDTSAQTMFDKRLDIEMEYLLNNF